MRRYIALTDEARAVIRAHSQGEFQENSLPSNKPGHRNVPLSYDTVARLEEQMYPGETYSECIIRMFSKGAKQ